MLKDSGPDGRRTRQMTAWLSALLASLFVAASTGAAWAAKTDDTPVTWSVAPADADGPTGRASVELSLDPGETITRHLAVTNLGQQEARFALTTADGYYTSAGRFNMLEASEQSVDAGTWMTMDSEVTIAAGKSAVVPYTLTVPVNATPGDHAAGIAASVRTSAVDADGTQIGVDSRIGFRISTRVTGDLVPSLDVTDVQGKYRPSWSLFSPGRISVTYTATNAGNTTLSVTDRLSGIESEHGNLLPGENRAVTIERAGAWPLGLLFLDLVVDGAVPADTLTAAPHTQSLVVWAVPWLYLLALLGISLILFAIFAGRRRNQRRFNRLLEQARDEGRRETVGTGNTT